jgi:hypothetical protein
MINYNIKINRRNRGMCKQATGEQIRIGYPLAEKILTAFAGTTSSYLGEL